MMKTERASLLCELLTQLQQAHVTMAFCLEELRRLLDADLNPDAAALDADTISPSRPIVDETTFSVRWDGRTCRLGHTLVFRLFARLARRPNHYVSYDQLLRDVWCGDVRSAGTIRSAIRHLRNRLNRAHMRRLARAIHGRGRYYALILGASQ